MADSVRFQNDKKTILIVEDEFINQEILKNILEDNYNLLLADDGLDALDIIDENKDNISLILLDLVLPGLNGIEVLKRIKSNVDYKNIPVIVMTADSASEEATLNIGAVDFIPKPYPNEGVIVARIKRVIELFEDRVIINDTEKDNITGLYNKDYFIHYVKQLDIHHKEVGMDAIMLDVAHFHVINDRFGFNFGNQVLKAIAGKIKTIVKKDGGLACRREGDIFLLYTPHISDYDSFLKAIGDDLFVDKLRKAQTRLKLGIYENVDKTVPVETRFDRAKFALNNAGNNAYSSISFYDKSLYEKELFEEQLVDDFKRALKENEFEVYYQPKFNIQKSEPYLVSCEALIRWNHKTLGMVSPGVFIPLFENNGLIQELDNYVWERAAKQIVDWKERFHKTIPVSVNVSRIDIHDPQLIAKFKNIVGSNDLDNRDIILEITESAYVSDESLIVRTINELKQQGFIIEMDDFGTGYSSLNMISNLPIDVLKLDMVFIRNAFKENKNTKILELIINLAKKLSLKVVAEGVETKEQVDVLKELGCDIVQGYYFSKPVKASEFEKFIRQEI